MIHIEYYESSACNLDFWRVPPPPPLCVPLSWPVWTSSFMSECVCVNERRWMSVCVKTDTVVPPVTAGCSCSSAAWCSLWSSLSPHLRQPLLCVCLTESRSWADDGVNHLLEKKKSQVSVCVFPWANLRYLRMYVCDTRDVILKRDLHIEKVTVERVNGGKLMHN